jgi:alanine racemase
MTLLLPAPVGLAVDLDAVAANTRTFASRTSGAVMAVVKADGFGHGAPEVAATALAHGASWLGVTSLAEALALRAAGLRAPVLSWLNPVDADHGAAAEADVDVAVPGAAHLAAVARAHRPGARPPRVHLHLDTGMARDGATPAAWEGLCGAARSLERAGVVRVVGVMGHLACADVPSDPANAAGRAAFARGLATARAAGLRPPLRHLAATSATLTDPASHHTLSRIGAGLVGIDPTRTTTLSPALTLTAPVVDVRHVPAGVAVGYARTWVADRPTTLALLPLGYADGLPRAASGRAEVLLRGRRRRVVGRISMDQVVVDVGDDAVAPGEVATLFGPGRSGEPLVADWAAWAGTIEHEIVTGIGARVTRTVR